MKMIGLRYLFLWALSKHANTKPVQNSKVQVGFCRSQVVWNFIEFRSTKKCISLSAEEDSRPKFTERHFCCSVIFLTKSFCTFHLVKSCLAFLPKGLTSHHPIIPVANDQATLATSTRLNFRLKLSCGQLKHGKKLVFQCVSLSSCTFTDLPNCPCKTKSRHD